MRLTKGSALYKAPPSRLRIEHTPTSATVQASSYSHDLYLKENKELLIDFLTYIEDEQNYSPNTVTPWRYQLNTFRAHIGNTDISTLTIHDISLYLRVRAQTVKVSSLNTERAVLRSFFKYIAHYRGMPLAFDYSMIRNAKEDDRETPFIDIEQLKRLIPLLPTTQDKLMLILMFAAALRIGELVRLTVENVRGRELLIKGKGGKRRVVPIPTELAEALSEFILDEGIPTGTMFRHRAPKATLRNHGYTVNGYRKRLDRQLKRHGIHIHPHWCRHGGATELVTNGMDIRTLMDYLGHSRIETTQRYLHITDTRLKEAYDKSFPVDKLNLKNYL